MTSDGKPRIAVCCDTGPHAGSIHLLRSLALAEELLPRGAGVVFVCDTGSSPQAELQIGARSLEAVAPADTPQEHEALLDRLEADAVVFDSRAPDAEACAAARRTGRPTLAVVDGDPHGAKPDLLVDPNVGAEEDRADTPEGTTLLAGTDFALMRNDVLANRPIAPPRHDSVEVPRVTAVVDPDDASAGPCLARVLAATGRPFDATFVAAGEEARAGVAEVRPAPRQRIRVSEPTWRLHETVARSDVVLGDAGAATYEWLCLGAATGLVWSAEEHVERYRRLMVRRAVIGLGSASDLSHEPESGVDKATRLLSDARERARLGEAGWRLVDGMGRARVADALLALL